MSKPYREPPDPSQPWRAQQENPDSRVIHGPSPTEDLAAQHPAVSPQIALHNRRLTADIINPQKS